MYKRGAKRNVILSIPSIQGTPSRWPRWTATHKKKNLSTAIIALYFKLFNGLFTPGLPWCPLFYLDWTEGQGGAHSAIHAPRRCRPVAAWSRAPRQALRSSCSTGSRPPTPACIWDHKAITAVPLHTYWWLQDLPCHLTLTPLHLCTSPNLIRSPSWLQTLPLQPGKDWSAAKCPRLATSSLNIPLLLPFNWNLTVPWSHSLLERGRFSSSTTRLEGGLPVFYVSHCGLWKKHCLPSTPTHPQKTEFWWSSCNQHVLCLGIYLFNALYC